MRTVKVAIQSNQDRFTINLTVDGRSSKYSGVYAAKSDVLDAGNLRVLADGDEILVLESSSIPELSGRSIVIARTD